MPMILFCCFRNSKHNFTSLSFLFFRIRYQLITTANYCQQPFVIFFFLRDMICTVKEVNTMTNSNSGSNNKSGSNRMAVPEAKGAMNRFKEEVASELGVPLKDGYNGDLTSRQAGSIGGEMVKKMIQKQEEQMR